MTRLLDVGDQGAEIQQEVRHLEHRLYCIAGDPKLGACEVMTVL